MNIETTNYLLALSTVGLQVLTVAFLVLFFWRKKFPDLEGIVSFLEQHGLWIGFALTLVGSALTLYYSEVLGLAACIMCWWQRICLYPQIVILGFAALKKDRNAALSSMALSVIGACVALYQHLLQMGVTSAAPCNAIPGTDCAARFLFEFGYITFPLMAATLFAFLIVLMLFVRRK